MLRSIQKLIGDKRKQLIFPIFLMSLDAIGSLVMYLILSLQISFCRLSCWLEAICSLAVRLLLNCLWRLCL